MIFGNYITKIREDKNISKDCLSELSGVKKSHLSQIENNKIKPEPFILKRITRALNISHIDLLIQAGSLTEEDLEEHNQFQLGIIELVIDDYSMIGTQIKKNREDKNIPIDSFSKMSGVSIKHILQTENNTMIPGPKVLKRMTKILNINYIDLLIRAGFLTEEDLEEHNQFQLGTIELTVRDIVEIHYYNGILDEEYWDEKTFKSIRSAKYYLTKNGFVVHKDGYSKTEYFHNGYMRYLFAHIYTTHKTV